MEKQGKSQLNIALTYGTILGLASIILSLVFYALNQQFSKLPQWLGYIVMILFLTLGIKNYRDKELNGYISFGKALGTGVLISITAGLISTVYFLIFINYIDPEFITKMNEYTQQEMLDEGISEEQIARIMEGQGKFMTPGWIFLFGHLGYVFMGTIFSLIISLFLKKRDESFESNFGV